MRALLMSRVAWYANVRWLVVAIIVAVALLVLGSTVRAAEPAKYYLEGDRVVERRVAEHDKKLEDQDRRIAALEKLLSEKSAAAAKPSCPGGCVTAPGGAGTCGSYSCPANGGRSGCPCDAGPAVAAVDHKLHISPDGTVNVRHADGIYRPVPGAPRQAPPQTSPAPMICGPSGCYSSPAWSAPAYLPSYGSSPSSGSSCPGGRCPLPR